MNAPEVQIDDLYIDSLRIAPKKAPVKSPTDPLIGMIIALGC